MSKIHIVHVKIVNNTEYAFFKTGSHFEQGRLSSQEWPLTIEPKTEIEITCDGHNSCSGWVGYTYFREPPYVSPPLYFSFSNGSNNCVGVGTDEKETYNNMVPHVLPVQEVFPKSSHLGKYITVNMSSTNGTNNHALWVINQVNTNTEIPANYEVENVTMLYDSIGDEGSRMFYEAKDEYSIGSHFKGVGAFKDKLIFTHSNLMHPPGHYPHRHQGLYLIGNKVAPGNNGAVIEALYKTEHDPKWGHPGGVQVCGTYMVLGLQRTDDSKHSEIQIYDIRNTQINQPMTLVTTITRNTYLNKKGSKKGGINGTGMTKESEKNGGSYIIACSDGQTLDIYRSDQNEMNSDTTFTQLKVRPPRAVFKRIHGGAGLGLITQEGGKLFLIGMHASDEGPSTLNLYEITIEDDKASYKRVRQERILSLPSPRKATQEVTSDSAKTPALPPLDAANSEDTDSNFTHTSFRWGKGLSIISPVSVGIYATQRNIHIDSGRFAVGAWAGRIEKRIDKRELSIVEPHNVEQSYTGNQLTVSWQGLENKTFDVKVVNQQRTSNELYPLLSTTESNTTSYSVQVPTDSLSQSKHGMNVISAVRTMVDGQPLSPFIYAATPNYRLGQAIICDEPPLTYHSDTHVLSGKWTPPSPLNPKNPDQKATGYDCQILDSSGKVIGNSSETDTSGTFSIKIDGLETDYYYLQIRATGQDNVIPGEWSVTQGFPVYNFPPVDSNSGNAPKGSVGYFLIGDEAIKDDEVTFWGNNWIQMNGLSGGSDSSQSEFHGYAFVNGGTLNDQTPPHEFEGCFNAEYNSGVKITEGLIYSMPVISTLDKGSDTGLGDHFVATTGKVTMIVNVQIDSFDADRTNDNAGTGTIKTTLWKAPS